MDKVFSQKRDSYYEATTLGKLYAPDKSYICETLEDIVRCWGVKHGGSTAIPAGRYRMTVSYSSKFKRKMVMIYTEANKYEIKLAGIGFKGVRMHGGNDNKDTWGCVIVARNRIAKDRVQGSMELVVTEMVERLEKEGHSVYLEVVNLSQKE